MARSNPAISAATVKTWFRSLPFDEKAALAQALTEEVNGEKANRIRALEAELQALKGSHPHTPRAAPAKNNGSPLAGKKVPAKYADKQGHTWSGRGIKPRWLQDALKKGGKLEQFLIGKTKG